MAKTKNIELNSKELKKLKDELDQYSENMMKAAKNIVADLSEFGVKKMEEIYNGFYLSGNQPSTFEATGTDLEKTVSMSGAQAVYDEFGTGTFGEMSPHPVKGAFNLNEYNSGRTIRRATKEVSDKAREKGYDIPTGELYWTYKDNNGQIVYSRGTPAQKEVYDSFLATIQKADEVVVKRISEVLKDG